MKKKLVVFLLLIFSMLMFSCKKEAERVREPKSFTEEYLKEGSSQLHVDKNKQLKVLEIEGKRVVVPMPNIYYKGDENLNPEDKILSYIEYVNANGESIDIQEGDIAQFMPNQDYILIEEMIPPQVRETGGDISGKMYMKVEKIILEDTKDDMRKSGRYDVAMVLKLDTSDVKVKYPDGLSEEKKKATDEAKEQLFGILEEPLVVSIIGFKEEKDLIKSVELNKK